MDSNGEMKPIEGDFDVPRYVEMKRWAETWIKKEDENPRPLLFQS